MHKVTEIKQNAVKIKDNEKEVIYRQKHAPPQPTNEDSANEVQMKYKWRKELALRTRKRKKITIIGRKL